MHRVVLNTSGFVLNHKILINIPALWCIATVMPTIILESMWHFSYFSVSSFTPFKNYVYTMENKLYRERAHLLH